MQIEAASLAKLGPLISKLAEAFATPAKGIATRTKETLQIKFRKGFARFLEENLVRFSTVKTIISSATPIPFLSLYVNLYVESGERTFRDEDFLERIGAIKRVFFSASAGSGKSMLMRYLYLRFLETQTDRLPVFIELRELNEHRKRSLQEHIRARIADYIEGFSEHQLKYALETGRMILFLDGLDEVDHDQRRKRELQINELVNRYKSLWTFVSCRPAETFANWQAFHAFELKPLSKSQVERLVHNIPYDESAKETFRRKLADGLYESHEQFLTNPLLTIMMLVTLEQFAEVPAKIHLFYEYAFEALFGRHDATKAGFQRKRHTTLAMDDFKHLFAYFCMITYAKQARAFSADRTLDFIQQAITSSQIQTDKELFKLDLTESTCMLVRDGLDYTFSHRSFQEYFTAYFLCRVKIDEFQSILRRLVDRAAFDSVIEMIAEMNRERFEEAWAFPVLSKLYERVRDIDPRKNCIAFDAAEFERWPWVSATISSGEELEESILHLSGSNEAENEREQYVVNCRFVLYQVYGIFGLIHRSVDGEDAGVDLQIVKQIASGELLGDDARFESWRDAASEDDQTYYPLVRMEDSDHKWFRHAHWGRTLQLERKHISNLLHEIENRIDARRKGLAAIFDKQSG